MENKYLSLATYPGVISSPVKYDNNNCIPFSNGELKKSLETIVSNDKSKHINTILEGMFSDKSKSLKASVNALLEEIKLRESINVYHLKKVEYEVCKQHTRLMQIDNLNDHHPSDLTKYFDDAKNKIESNVLDLEKEKRKEQLECWRDLMFLKKYLMSALKDYWELARKRKVLEG